MAACLAAGAVVVGLPAPGWSDPPPPATNETYQPTNAEWLARYNDGQEPIKTAMGGQSNPSSSLVRTPEGVVRPGQPVTFDGSGSRARHNNHYGGTEIVSWVWDFGDGFQANGEIVEHAFERPGVYHVNLTVHDDTGWRSQKDHVIQVGDVVDEVVSEELSIPTGDGLVMHGWVTRPVGEGPYPVVLTYGPYGTGPVCTCDPNYDLVRNGYAVASVAAPGRELSTGHFDMFGRQTQQGGYDAVEYLAALPWSSGKVGLVGLSGPAVGALLTAAASPPHLAAVVAKSSFADMYRDIITAGGVPNSNTFVNVWVPTILAQDAPTLQATGRYEDLGGRTQDTARIMAEMATHTQFDDYWAERAIVDYPSPSAPVLYFGNQRDLWPRATVEISRWIAPSGGRVVSIPGGHAFPDISGWVAGRNAGDYAAGEARTWLDHHLMGIENGVENRPAALTASTYGGDVAAAFNFGRFEALNGFLTGMVEPRRLYLRSAGTNMNPLHRGLSTDPPGADESPSLLPYSPAQGATSDDTAATAPLVAGLQGSWESHSLVYETDVLESDLHVNGPATLSFYASLAAPDLAFTVHVNDVWPDGSSHYISKGALLASHRALDEERSLYLHDGPEKVLMRAYHPHTGASAEQLVPGTVYRFDIEVWGIHNVFKAGHRLRLALAAQDLGWRTHYTPGPAAIVHNDSARPSVLNLPVLRQGLSRHPFPFDRIWNADDGADWGAPGKGSP
jgi:putative CocE/NonD family hydrolase